MSVLSRPIFHDEKAAFAYVESIIWPKGPVCPHCGGMDRAYALEGVRSKPSKKNPEGVERFGLWKCGHCRNQFTVRKGTIFEESHMEMHKWLQAIHLMCSGKKGISAHQLHRILEVQYKTAWFVEMRIREAMPEDEQPYRELGSVEGYVSSIERDGRGASVFRIRTRLHRQVVKVTLRPDAVKNIERFSVGQVLEGLRVRVHGVLKYAGLGKLEEVAATELEVFDPFGLPGLDDIIDPDLTDGQRTEDFLRGRRDE